jgi:hypothetical protein
VDLPVAATWLIFPCGPRLPGHQPYVVKVLRRCDASASLHHGDALGRQFSMQMASPDGAALSCRHGDLRGFPRPRIARRLHLGFPSRTVCRRDLVVRQGRRIESVAAPKAYAGSALAVVVVTWTAPIPCSAEGYARVPRRRAAAKSSRSGSPLVRTTVGLVGSTGTRGGLRRLRRRRAARLHPGGDDVGAPQRNRGLARRRLYRDQCARLPAMRGRRHGAARSGTRQSSDEIRPVTPRVFRETIPE